MVGETHESARPRRGNSGTAASSTCWPCRRDRWRLSPPPRPKGTHHDRHDQQPGGAAPRADGHPLGTSARDARRASRQRHAGGPGGPAGRPRRTLRMTPQPSAGGFSTRTATAICRAARSACPLGYRRRAGPVPASARGTAASPGTPRCAACPPPCSATRSRLVMVATASRSGCPTRPGGTAAESRRHWFARSRSRTRYPTGTSPGGRTHSARRATTGGADRVPDVLKIALAERARDVAGQAPRGSLQRRAALCAGGRKHRTPPAPSQPPGPRPTRCLQM